MTANARTSSGQRNNRRSRNRNSNEQSRRSSQSGGRKRSGRGSQRNKSSRQRARGRDGRERQQPSAKDVATFWGDRTSLPEPRADIRISETPAAVPRSLGPPPLPGQDAVAEHYFTAIYARAVTTAGALAAAGGLIDPESLSEDA